MFYLCIKTHNKTGLKYLCQTRKKDPIKYLGSGTRWIRHLNVHGKDISTTMLGKYKTLDRLSKAGIKYSKKFNVVKSRKWANLIPEMGEGGADTNKFIDYKNMKPMPTGLWKRPDLKKYNLTRINPNKDKKLSYHTRKKMSKAQTGRVITTEHRKNISKGRKGLKLSDEARTSSSKYVFKVKGVKKNLQLIAVDTGLDYSLLVQRCQKNSKITYKQLIKPSLKQKLIFNGAEYSVLDFVKYLNINIKTFYRWRKKGLSLDAMYKQKKSGQNLISKENILQILA